jgi:hypothetical protein
VVPIFLITPQEAPEVRTCAGRTQDKLVQALLWGHGGLCGMQGFTPLPWDGFLHILRGYSHGTYAAFSSNLSLFIQNRKLPTPSRVIPSRLR